MYIISEIETGEVFGKYETMDEAMAAMEELKTKIPVDPDEYIGVFPYTITVEFIKIVRCLRYDAECDTLPEDIGKFCVSTIDDPTEVNTMSYSVENYDTCKQWLAEQKNSVTFDRELYKIVFYTVETGIIDNMHGYIAEESLGASETEYFGC